MSARFTGGLLPPCRSIACDAPTRLQPTSAEGAAAPATRMRDVSRRSGRSRPVGHAAVSCGCRREARPTRPRRVSSTLDWEWTVRAWVEVVSPRCCGPDPVGGWAAARACRSSPDDPQQRASGPVLSRVCRTERWRAGLAGMLPGAHISRAYARAASEALARWRRCEASSDAHADDVEIGRWRATLPGPRSPVQFVHP